MKSMSESKLQIKRKLSVQTLVMCWLFVFVLPAVSINLGLKWLFKINRETSRRSFNPRLVNEMQKFKVKATVRSYIKDSLAHELKSSKNSLLKMPSLKIRKLLEQEYGYKIVCLIKHGKDTGDIDYSLSPEAKEKFRFWPRTMSRRALIAYNNQYKFSFFSKTNRSYVNRLLQKYGIEKLEESARLFIQKQFALIAQMPLMPGTVSKSYSGKFNAPLYFYYHPCKNSSSNKIEGGMLLVIKTVGLSMKRVLRSALNASEPEFARKIVRCKFPIAHERKNIQKALTGFISGKNRYSLLTTLSQETVVDLIQVGTLYPHNLEKIKNNMPLLEVSISDQYLQHSFYNYRGVIFFLCRLLVLLGTVFLIYIHLFGFEFKAGIRKKVVFGIALILFLPVTLLTAALFNYSGLRKLDDEYRFKSAGRQKLGSLRQSFEDYLTNVQSNSFKLAKKLKNLDKLFKENKIKEILSSSMKRFNASSIFLDHPVWGPTTVEKRELRPEETSETEMLRLISTTMLSRFNEKGEFVSRSKSFLPKLFELVSNGLLNNVINKYGRFFEYSRFKTGNRYSFLPIFKPGSVAYSALLSIKYDQYDLIDGFLKQLDFEKSGNSGFSFYLVRLINGRTEFYNYRTGKKVINPDLLANLEKASPGNGFFYENKGLNYMKHFSDYPLIGVYNNPDYELLKQRSDNASIFYLILLYSSGLILFAYLVIGEIYLKPLNRFIGFTRKVADNNYSERINTKTKDEFALLASAFNQMNEGLEQKEYMSQFVSRDVIEAVHAKGDSNMQPGGEKVETSIVFIQLKEIQNEQDPEKVRKLFDEFIEVAQNSSERYGGIIDKLIEDTLMLVFRSNQLSENHAISAALASLEIQRCFKDFTINAGIASGKVISGRIGSKTGKLDYTVIGDTVNLAARLKAQAKKAQNTGIIIAPSSIRKLRGLARVNFIERIPIKGKSRNYPLYELYGLRKRQN
jgi:class 3 adenylate cyclase